MLINDTNNFEVIFKDNVQPMLKKATLLEVILIFSITFIAYAYFSSNSDWNTNSRLALVKSIVLENRFEIDSFRKSPFLPTKDVARFLDHYYSDKAIGSSLIGNVFYFPIAAAERALGVELEMNIFIELLTILAVSLIDALLAPFVYLFVKRVSHSTWFAFLVTMAICLGTPIYKYSTVYYGHVLAGLFLFATFFIWFSMRNDAQLNPVKVLASGLFLGYAIISEYPVVVVAFVVGLYILYILWKQRRLWDYGTYIRLAIGFAAPIMIVLAYNYAVFRHPFKTGYAYEIVPQFIEGQSSGLMGIGMPDLNVLFYMTLHPTMGVFLQSPVLLLAFWGWVRMWQDSRYRAEAVLSFGVILVYFLMMSGYYLWWGGIAFTPRGLIPIFPFFCIPLAFLVKKWERIALLVLALVSMFQMFAVAASSGRELGGIIDNMPATSISLMFQQPSIIYNVYIPNLFKQSLVVNRGQEILHLRGFPTLVPFFVLEIGLLAAFVKIILRKEKSLA